jgi:hypothetical protein
MKVADDSFFLRYNAKESFAGMVELVDTPGLGSGG